MLWGICDITLFINQSLVSLCQAEAGYIVLFGKIFYENVCKKFILRGHFFCHVKPFM